MKRLTFMILLLSSIVLFGCWEKEPWENYCIWISDAYYLIGYSMLENSDNLWYNPSNHELKQHYMKIIDLKKKVFDLYNSCMKDKEYEWMTEVLKNELEEETIASIENEYLYCLWFSRWEFIWTFENDTGSDYWETFNRGANIFMWCLENEQYNNKFYAHTFYYR